MTEPTLGPIFPVTSPTYTTTGSYDIELSGYTNSLTVVTAVCKTFIDVMSTEVQVTYISYSHSCGELNVRVPLGAIDTDIVPGPETLVVDVIKKFKFVFGSYPAILATG